MSILPGTGLKSVARCVLIMSLFLIPSYVYAQSGCDLSANQCCEKSGKAALSSCEQAISCMSYKGLLPSNYPRVYMCRGIILGEMGRTEEALQALNKSIQYDPDNAKSHYNRGIVLEELGHDRKARRAYKKAVKFNPQMTLAWGNLGVSAFNIGHYKEAVESFDTATELDSSYFDNKPEQRELFDKAVNVRPWSASLGHEISVRFTPNLGYLFKFENALEPYVHQFIYIMPEAEIDIQLYKRLDLTTSFMYMRTTGSQIDATLNLYGISFGAKYVSNDEIDPCSDKLLDKSRLWVSIAAGPYITNLEASTVRGNLSTTSTNFGFNFGAGLDYFFYPNFGLGLQLKVHYVRFNGDFNGLMNFGDDYMIFSGGPTVIARF